MKMAFASGFVVAAFIAVCAVSHLQTASGFCISSDYPLSEDSLPGTDPEVALKPRERRAASAVRSRASDASLRQQTQRISRVVRSSHDDQDDDMPKRILRARGDMFYRALRDGGSGDMLYRALRDNSQGDMFLRAIKAGRGDMFYRALRGGKGDMFYRALRGGKGDMFYRALKAGNKSDMYYRALKNGKGDMFYRALRGGKGDMFYRAMRGGKGDMFYRALRGDHEPSDEFSAGTEEDQQDIPSRARRSVAPPPDMLLRALR